MGFTKLDEGILQSSIMAEDGDTFKVWVALLATCKQDGIAHCSSVFIASICRLPQKKADEILKKFENPDPRSRSKEQEGRRIKRVDGGYELINYFDYRDSSLKDAEAERKRIYRQKIKGKGEDGPDNSGQCPDNLGHVPTSPDSSASASASASSLSSKDKDQEKKEGGCEIDIKLVQLLIDLMLENNPESSTIKRLTPKRQEEWIRQCRLLRERDGKAPEQIEAVIKFSQADSFWKGNILSMPTLREKWDQLWMKAKKEDQYSGIKEWLNENKK